MTAIERVIATARAEIGYIEKATNSQLEGKTANAGSGNWTKYAAFLDGLGVYNFPKNGYAWCDMFVDWCYITTFGLSVAMKMTNQPMGGYGAGCTQSAGYYRAVGRFHKSNPQPGDQIFFTNDGGKSMYHTGLVEKVTGYIPSKGIPPAPPASFRTAAWYATKTIRSTTRRSAATVRRTGRS
jgi:hypothetical protein